MKSLAAAAAAGIDADHVVLGGALQLDFSITYRLWSGLGELTIDGQVYSGVDSQALLISTTSSLGGSIEGITITLSGLDPRVAATILEEDFHQRAAIFRRLIFDAATNELLDAPVWLRGRVDEVTIIEDVGGAAEIVIAIEGPGRDLERSGARLRSDADQRLLGGALDGSLKHVAVAAKRSLSWGKRPANAPLIGANTTPLIGIGQLP